MRKMAPAEDTAIVVLSSSLTTPSHVSHEQLQIARKLSKPIRRAELHEAIASALEKTSKRSDSENREIQPAARNLRLLLVEDNTVNQKLAIRLLEKMGHQVQLAVNGREAVDLAGATKFDLILMDVQMPVMGGLEATQQIRQQEAHTGRHTPILAMTAHAMKGDQEKCFEAGMDGYVSKPIRTELLKQEIARLTVKGQGEPPMTTTPHETSSNGQEGAVSLPELLARVENDWDLLRELAGIFREEFPRYLSTLRSAIQEGNFDQARESAHALKGMLANLAAGRAAEAASELEDFAKTGQQAALAGSLTKFEAETKGLLAELEGYVVGAEK
jgi:CheY-like chemotaxis protein/HPt (histidine-containing phosphotransfer) domain-containing protein